jgi:hypothetical protein
MKKIIILILFIIVSSFATTDVTSGRDKQKSLMLTPNTQMHKNKSYYSKHKIQNSIN